MIATEIEERAWLRWVILGVISIILFGSYYVYDLFSPINDFIQDSMGIDNSTYGLLATFYSLPNLLFLVVLAGVILDRAGIKKAGIIFGLLCVVGSLITTLAAGRSFTWML